MPIKSITTKFILTVLLANCLLLTSYYVISTQGFQHQFLQYLVTEEQQKVKTFADSLSGQYNVDREGFINIRRQWPVWMSNYFDARLPPGPAGGEEFSKRPKRKKEGRDRPPKHKKRKDREGKRPKNKKRRDEQGRHANTKDRAEQGKVDELHRRLALFDENKSHWIGPPEITPTIFYPVTVGNRIVAYVGYVSRESLPPGSSEAFVDAFDWSQKILVICLLLLNLILSVFLTKHFIIPVKQVMTHANRLKSGDYKSRFANSRRQDELGLLMKNMDTLGQTLAEQQESQRRWLADVAHELRTPLAVLKGEIEAIVDGIRPNTIEQIKSLQQEVNHLQRLVEDLRQLSLSDMGALSYFYEQFDLGELLTDVIERMGKQFQSSNLSFEAHGLDMLTIIEADATRLTQVFHNLLTNSCRYTDSPGQIKLTLKTQKEFVLVQIEDSAPSVDDAQLEQLFEPLFRVDQARQKVKGGSGLGMSICRAIVKAHQGEISASASELGGIKVRVKIPKEQYGTKNTNH